MESYKDVMLSEPPSRFTAAPSVQPVNLETYKGILLCDRPQAAVAKNDAPIPFLPAGRGEDKFVGIQPSNEQRARLQMIRNTNQAKSQTGNAIVARHKKWLRSFANAVKQAKLDKAEHELVSNTRAAAFRDRQSHLRSQQSAPHEEQEPVVAPTAAPKAAAPKKSAKQAARPKWAMTADEAATAEEDEMLAECDDLLSFANNLDYDRFIHDMEVKEALSIMKERVGEIIKDEGGQMYRDEEGCPSECPSDASTTTRAVYRLAAKKAQDQAAAPDAVQAAHDASWNASTRVNDRITGAIRKEALTLAEKILANSTSLNRIHTKHSLAKVLQEAVGVVEKDTCPHIDVCPGQPIQPPAVATVGAHATGHESTSAPHRVLTDLRKAKDKTQNLPYLYRCPAL